MAEIRIKRSSTPGAMPTLADGELAVNLADEVLFIGKSGTNIEFRRSHATDHLPGGADPISPFSSSQAGLVPPPGPGGARYLSSAGTWDAIPSLSGGLPVFRPPGIEDYVVPYVVAASTTVSASLVAGRCYWIPFRVWKAVQVSGLAINVLTASAGTVTLLIYSPDSGGIYPGARIYQSAGLDTGTTGIKTDSLTLALQPGVYWVALFTTSAATVRAIVQGNMPSFGLPLLGTGNTVGFYTVGFPGDPAPTSGYSSYVGSLMPAVGFQYSVL